jgi:hydroxymethylpyrimidine/phosphomethylpyrimidine kinase
VLLVYKYSVKDKESAMKKALTIAGSDCSGGAGIQADLKTFAAHAVYGMSVITAVTVQNTQKVFAVQDISPDIVAQQIEALFEDIEIDGVKIGMVSQVSTIEVIADLLGKYAPSIIVVDPVMISTSGYHLLKPEAEAILIKRLLPLAYLLTPNIPEAETIARIPICTLPQMEEAAKIICQMGSKNVLLKGGHLKNDAIDILYDGQQFSYFSSARINTKNTHGTGCTLSSAITANLILGNDIVRAVAKAKDYLTTAIKHSFSIGKGNGPVNHFYTLYKQAGLIK